MPSYKVDMPDGRSYQVDMPEKEPAIGEIREAKGLAGRAYERAGVPTTLEGWKNHPIRGLLGLVMLPTAALGEAVSTLGETAGYKRPVSREHGDLGDLAEQLSGVLPLGKALGSAARMPLGSKPFNPQAIPQHKTAVDKLSKTTPDTPEFNAATKELSAATQDLDELVQYASRRQPGGPLARRTQPPARFGAMQQPTGGPTIIPTTPAPGLNAPQTYWQQLKSKIKDVLPQDYFVWKIKPNSGVITAYENSRTTMDDIMEGAHRQKGLWGHTMDEWVDAEDQAVRIGQAHMANPTPGITTVVPPTGHQAALRSLPIDMQEAVLYMHSLRPYEKHYRDLLGGVLLKDEPLYVVPHVLKKDFDEALKIDMRTQGLANDIRTTLGVFEKPRTYSSIKEGMAKNPDIEYIDPRTAIAFRVWASAKLIRTGKFVEDALLRGVIFPTEDLAKANSAAGKAFLVEAIPGSRKWWATTREEALWIKHHMQDPHTFGALARAAEFGNQWFRNTNLWNPLPHFTKNMLYKYGFSGGDFRRVFSDMNEIKNNSNPQMISLYKQYMPYNEGGRTAHDYYYEILDQISGNLKLQPGVNSLLRPFKEFANNPTWSQFQHSLSAPNNASSRLLFSKWDPWLKYSRFKQYVEAWSRRDPTRSLPDIAQEAANQVHMDLIRYSMRSDAIDVWKSLPMNFFVPWRVGTVQSAAKNIKQAPIKAALYVAGWDLLREVYYRRTGDWLHLPIDYIQQPVAQLAESAGSADYDKFMEALTRTIIPGVAAGPGGHGSVRQIENMLNIVVGDPKQQMDRTLKSLFWNFSLMGDPRTGLGALKDFGETGDVKYLANILLNAGLGTHSSLTHEPPHMPWFKYAPEVGPLERSKIVKLSENRQKVMKLREQRRKARSGIRPDWTERMRQLEKNTP